MKKLVILTGAGMSSESGIKTFRDSGGLWEEHDVAEVATPMAWSNNQNLVLKFYNERRRELAGCKPNDGHLGLVELEKNFDVQIITQNIDGIEYSIIPLEAKYENLINKYPEEIRVIETKELNTIFASDSIKSIPDTSLFSRCVRSRNDLYTFLMDMSVRKLDTLSKEEELNNQLKLISQNKSICMSELEAELIELLNNEVGVNVESIKEYKSEINKILNTLLNYST